MPCPSSNPPIFPCRRELGYVAEGSLFGLRAGRDISQDRLTDCSPTWACRPSSKTSHPRPPSLCGGEDSRHPAVDARDGVDQPAPDSRFRPRESAETPGSLPPAVYCAAPAGPWPRRTNASNLSRFLRADLTKTDFGILSGTEERYAKVPFKFLQSNPQGMKEIRFSDSVFSHDDDVLSKADIKFLEFPKVRDGNPGYIHVGAF